MILLAGSICMTIALGLQAFLIVGIIDSNTAKDKMHQELVQSKIEIAILKNPI